MLSCGKIQIDKCVAWQKTNFKEGKEVALLNPIDLGPRVGFGKVAATTSVFHGCTIPPHYIRIDVIEVLKNIEFMIPIVDAKQKNLIDALGSTILWFKDFVTLDEEGS